MTDLVKALDKHVSTPNWNKDVAAKLDKMIEAVSWSQLFLVRGRVCYGC